MIYKLATELKVKCKECNTDVILTNKDALDNWKKHGEICFRCNRKIDFKKKGSYNIEIENKEKEILLQNIKECFLAYKKSWAEHHDCYEKLSKSLEKLFGKDFDYFSDFMHESYEEFFAFGEGNISWDNIKEVIDEFEELKKEENL